MTLQEPPAGRGHRDALRADPDTVGTFWVGLHRIHMGLVPHRTVGVGEHRRAPSWATRFWQTGIPWDPVLKGRRSVPAGGVRALLEEGEA